MHDVCIIGHVTRDLVRRQGGPTETGIGGVAYYAGIALRSLGVDTAVLTSLAEADAADILAPLSAAGVTIYRRASPTTTCFENVYSGRKLARRRQRVAAVAAPFEPDDLAGIRARAFHLGPLTDADMSMAFLSTVVGRAARVSLDVQGFTRRLEAGEVRRTDWAEKSQGLARVGIVHASRQEAWYLTGEDDPERAVRALAALSPEEVVVTLGGDGAIICAQEEVFRIPAVAPRAVVDPTGCGDSYMAGYLFHRMRSDDIAAAGCFAAALATCNLERTGPFVGDEREVRARLERFRSSVD